MTFDARDTFHPRSWTTCSNESAGEAQPALTATGLGRSPSLFLQAGMSIAWLVFHAARRCTSQTVEAMSRSDNTSSPLPTIPWTDQKWLAGW